MFISQDKLSDIGRRLERVEFNIEESKRKIRQLECNHSETEFYFGAPTLWVEKCRQCDKEIKDSLTDEQKLESELKRLKEKIQSTEEDLKKIQGNK